MAEKLYASPNVLIFPTENGIGLWDFVIDCQLLMDLEHIYCFLQISRGETPTSIKIVDDLLSVELVSRKPFASIDWGWSQIAKAYHFTSKNIGQALSLDNAALHAKQYLDICANNYKEVNEEDLRLVRSGNVVKLPHPDLYKLNDKLLVEILYQRKTKRNFIEKSISIESISILLYLCFGEIHGKWQELEDYGLRVLGLQKSSPSAGATHSCQAYLVSLAVDDLEKGVYHYQSNLHSLACIKQGDFSKGLGHMLSGQSFAENMSAIVIITSSFDKLWRKYQHSRAYRMPFIDAGHLSQTFHLVGASLGLGTWLSGIFQDKEISELLEISFFGPEQPIFVLGVGVSDGDFLYPAMRKAISEANNV